MKQVICLNLNSPLECRPMLPIYVINLASSSARRERISARLNALKIPFEIFPAVDGRTQPHPLFARYDDSKRQWFKKRPLSLGELGCFSSHYLLWEKCRNQNQPLIVMEDDVVIEDAFLEASTLAEALLKHLSFIRLHGTGTHRRPYKVVAQFGSYTLRDYIRGPTGALCYAITPKAASALIENAHHWYMAVDDYIDRYWTHHVDSFALSPFRISVGNNESDIDRTWNRKSKLTTTLRHEFGKRIDRSLRFFYRLRNANKKADIIKQCIQTVNIR